MIREKLAERLRYFRERAGMTIYEAGERIGKSGKTVNAWENGRGQPDADMQVKLCEVYGIDSVAQLYGEPGLPGNILPLPKMKKVPLLGAIACGVPILAQENIESWINMPETVRADFVLRCEGDSMKDARILDGDLVFIRRQDDVLDGQIAAVLIDDEATLKRVYHTAVGVLLQPANAAYQPIMIGGPDETRQVRVLGLATHFVSAVR